MLICELSMLVVKSELNKNRTAYLIFFRLDRLKTELLCGRTSWRKIYLRFCNEAFKILLINWLVSIRRKFLLKSNSKEIRIVSSIIIIVTHYFGWTTVPKKNYISLFWVRILWMRSKKLSFVNYLTACLFFLKSCDFSLIFVLFLFNWSFWITKCFCS